MWIEREGKMKYYFIFCLLSICGWFDLKYREIPRITLCFGAVGANLLLIIQIFEGNKVWWDCLGGMSVGIVLVLISIVTNQQIGIGDGILFVLTGIGLGTIENIILLISSLCITGLTSLVLLTTKKIGRKTALPFIPFVWASFVAEIFFNRFL